MALLARLVAPEGLGQWALVAAATNVLHALLINWTQPASVRFGREEWTRQHTLAGSWSSRWPWLLLGGTTAILVLWVLPATRAGEFLGLTPSWRWLVIWHFVSLWLAAEVQSLLQATARFYALAALPLAATAGSLLYLWVLHARGGPTPLLMVLGGVVAASVVVWGVALVRLLRQSRAFGRSPARDGLVRTLRYGWPMIPGFVVGYLSDWGDHLLVRWYFSNREVGLFQAAYQTGMMALTLAVPLTTLLLPRLIDQSVHEPGVEGRYVTRVFPTLMACWGFASLPLAALLPDAFGLVFGPDFSESRALVSVLSLAIPGAALSQMYSTLFSLQGRLEQSVGIHVIMTLTNILGSLLLLPLLGPLGAALATAASYLISQHLYVLAQHRHLGLPNAPILLQADLLVVIVAAMAWAHHSMMLRLVLCAVGLLLFLAHVRHSRAVDEGTLRSLLGGSGAPLTSLTVRLLVRDHAPRPSGS